MSFVQSDNFLGFVLIIIFCNILNTFSYGYEVSLNISDEIKSIFKSNSTVPELRMLKGLAKKGNFAEGGLIQESNLTITKPLNNKTLVPNGLENIFTKSKIVNVAFKVPKQGTRNYNNESDNTSFKLIPKKEIPTKLSELGNNLFLGIPEVIHINGTSSIKPRKGVYYGKVEIYKDIGAENPLNSSSHIYNICSWTTKSDDPETGNFSGVTRFCCRHKITFSLEQQPLLNSDYCQPLNMSDVHTIDCQKIHCKSLVINRTNKLNNNTSSNNIGDIRTTFIFKQPDLVLYEQQKVQNFTDDISTTSKNRKVNFSKYTSKGKPVITKVPNDIDIKATNKSSKEFLVFIVASVFLVPLFIILLFFLWKKSKEIWEKRYYKRMDFLIDGIYND